MALESIESGAVKTLEDTLLFTSSWIMLAFFWIADSGILFPKHSQRKITKKEFHEGLKIESIQNLGSTVLAAGGTTLGYALGTVIMP